MKENHSSAHRCLGTAARGVRPSLGDRLLSSLLALGLVALAPPAAEAEGAPKRPVRIFERAQVTTQGDVPQIPFTMVNNHVLLPLSVNGSEPLVILLDTGMPGPGVVLYETPKIDSIPLGFDPNREVQVRGAGGEGNFLEARVAPAESLKLPGVSFTGSRVLVLPVSEHFSAYHDGAMGRSLFQNFVVELDYDQRVVRLHEPSSYRPPPFAQVLPLTLRHKVPHITVPLRMAGGDPFDAHLVVDLGAAHAISLNTRASKQIMVPRKALSTLLGRGLSGPIEGHVARIAELGLGRFVLKQVVSSFPVARHQNPRRTQALSGNLGNEVLRRFNTTFDYLGGRLILVPNESFREPFVHDHSGLHLSYGEQFRVEFVLDGSPADAAGVEVGDVLTHISGEIVGAKEIERVRAALRLVGDLRVTVQRGGKTLQKVVRLRRLI